MYTVRVMKRLCLTVLIKPHITAAKVRELESAASVSEFQITLFKSVVVLLKNLVITWPISQRLEFVFTRNERKARCTGWIT